MVQIRTISNLTTMARNTVTDLIKIYNSSVSAVSPQILIKNSVTYNTTSEELNINGNKFSLLNKKVFVVGTGKAIQHMAQEIDEILKHKIEKGIISIPDGSYQHTNKNTKLKYCEGAKNNLPDENAMKTATEIKDLAVSLSHNDVLLVLISGGGSALLPLPKDPITLHEKTDLIKRLANSGADIKELNTVRKKISNIKGGKLAMYSNPALTISLILSDIVGDPVDLIASAPTIENVDDPDKAKQIVKKYIKDDFPVSIKQVLEEKKSFEAFPKDHTFNYVLGSNKLSLKAAESEAKNLKYKPILLSNTVVGNVNNLAKEYVKLVKSFCDYLNNNNKKKLTANLESLNIAGIDISSVDSLESDEKNICLIFGGEPTVEVKGKGLGGRNQQLALEFSAAIHELKDDFENYNIHFLSAGTDGIDGPTNAAGAIGYLNLISDCNAEKIDAKKYIEENDSYNFYKNFSDGKFHIIKGHTNTNVMDVHFITICKILRN